MTADEIRANSCRMVEDAIASGGRDRGTYHLLALSAQMTAEIAAQLAEHNAHLERLERLAANVISYNGLQGKERP